MVGWSDQLILGLSRPASSQIMETANSPICCDPYEPGDQRPWCYAGRQNRTKTKELNLVPGFYICIMRYKIGVW